VVGRGGPIDASCARLVSPQSAAPLYCGLNRRLRASERIAASHAPVHRTRRPFKSAPIEFYVDIASPYGYLASEQIDALGERHGRGVVWHAIVLDANFQSQDRIRIPTHVMRSDYVRRDLLRSAAYFGIPYREPSNPGLHTETAARVF
jgi:hypothetical protein